jgi:hypothetical protein
MGVDHRHEQRRLCDTNTYTHGDDNPGDNTDADTHCNSYASHTDSKRDNDADRNPHSPATVAGTNAVCNSGIADANSTDTNANFDTNTKPKSGPTGAAQQPLDSDASPDW